MKVSYKKLWVMLAEREMSKGSYGSLQALALPHSPSCDATRR